MTETHYVIGVDLGQARDPSAICVIEQTLTTDLSLRDGVTFAHPQIERLALRHLERPELGTPYPDLVRRIVELSNSEILGGICTVVPDATGVGRPVIDMLREADLNAPLVPVVIVPGERHSEKDGYHHVPKRDLVSALAIALQKREIEIAHNLPLSKLLLAEMVNFKMKITAAGNDTFEAWRSGQHDDLVLAVALACWQARRRRREIKFGYQSSGPLILGGMRYRR